MLIIHPHLHKSLHINESWILLEVCKCRCVPFLVVLHWIQLYSNDSNNSNDNNINSSDFISINAYVLSILQRYGSYVKKYYHKLGRIFVVTTIKVKQAVQEGMLCEKLVTSHFLTNGYAFNSAEISLFITNELDT